MRTNIKKTVCFFLGLFYTSIFSAQVIEIHHIDVGTPGDATLIKVIASPTHGAPTVTRSILIDAGEPDAARSVMAYLTSSDGGNLGASPNLDYVIVSHYHDDHIGGLHGAASKKRPYEEEEPPDGNECPRYTGVVSSGRVNIFAILDKGRGTPFPIYRPTVEKVKQPYYTTNPYYVSYTTDVAQSQRGVSVDTGSPGAAANTTSITSPVPFYPTPLPVVAEQQLQLGDYIYLGQDLQGVQIRLRLWVADGYLWTPFSEPYKTDLGANYRSQNSNGGYSGKYLNANNWGLVWVLEYGQFRYYTGGDAGGVNTGEYINIEGPLAKQLALFYPTSDAPGAPNGHICSMKLSHHGSQHSTYKDFLTILRPAAQFISCGRDEGHNFPRQPVLDILEEGSWYPPSGPGNKKYFITEWNFLSENKGTKKKTNWQPKSINPAIGTISGSHLYFYSPVSPIKDCYCTPNPKGGFFCNNIYVNRYFPGVSGDIKICVNSANIRSQSTFSVSTRNHVTGAWNAPVTINCHTVNP